MSRKINTGKQAPSGRSGVSGVGVLEIPAEPSEEMSLVISYLQRFAHGEIPPKVTDELGDDHDLLKTSMNKLIDIISMRSSDFKDLLEAMEAGNLSFRPDPGKYSGYNGKMIAGLNRALDQVIGPVNFCAQYLDRIAKGDIPPKITDTFQGDFNGVKNNFNTCIDVLNGLLRAAEEMRKAQTAGDIEAFIDLEKFQGAYKEIAKDVNEAASLHIGCILKFLDIVGSYAEGDFSKVLERLPGKQILANQKMDLLRNNLTGLIAETTALTSAGVEGRLATRADGSKFAGDYRKIVEGVNQTLDAVTGPLNLAADCVDQIGKGVIPAKITDNLKGDFNAFKDHLNSCIDGLASLKEADRVLQMMAVNDYSQRIEGSALGIFGEVAKSVNEVQARVIHVTGALTNIAQGDLSELPVAKKRGPRSERDSLTPAMVALMESVNALVEDVTMLAKAAVDGNLGVRADTTKHHGDFRKIVEGVNQTLDSVLEPIQESAGVIAQIADQDLTARVEGKYRGDHAAIKDNVNRMGTDLRSSMQQIAQSASVLASASEELTASSQQMAGNAEETATQANVVSAAAEQVSKNVSVVATGAEQMQTSIREIAKSANEAAKIAKTAVRAAETTNNTIGKLGESSLEIGKVIKVITSIAQQTNLLALNATIEAARAGEAGKGFAVVANEVKELAKETAKATEDIGQKIEAIQSDTKGAVQAIAEIGAVINQVNDISNTIASAVEEQTVTTNEIGRNVTEAARGTSDIAKNISGVALAAQNTTQGASDSQKAASSLAAMAAQLQAIVAKFKL
jgi:methyl-accepting chemotaxis protein